MKYSEFKKELDRGEVPHVFLLSGDEEYYLDLAKKEILLKIFPQGEEPSIKEFTSEVTAEELLSELEAVPFFSTKKVLLVKNPKLLASSKKKSDTTSDAKRAKKHSKTTKTDIERLNDFLKNMPPETYIIFEVTDKIDKRKTFFKTLFEKGLVLEAMRLRHWEMDAWLSQKLASMNAKMTQEAREYFLNLVMSMPSISLYFFESEFEKLSLYTKATLFTKEDLEKIFSTVPEVSSFSMIDAIGAKNKSLAIAILERQLREGNNVPLLVGVLARYLRQLLTCKALLKRGVSTHSLYQELGVYAKIGEKLVIESKRFSEASLKKAFFALGEADFFSKRGMGGEEILEKIVLELSS